MLFNISAPSVNLALRWIHFSTLSVYNLTKLVRNMMKCLHCDLIRFLFLPLWALWQLLDCRLQSMPSHKVLRLIEGIKMVGEHLPCLHYRAYPCSSLLVLPYACKWVFKPIFVCQMFWKRGGTNYMLPCFMHGWNKRAVRKGSGIYYLTPTVCREATMAISFRHLREWVWRCAIIKCGIGFQVLTTPINGLWLDQKGVLLL